MSLLRRYTITALLYVAALYTDNHVALTALLLLAVVLTVRGAEVVSEARKYGLEVER